MTQYLLDTSIVSNLIREPQGRIADAIRSVGEDHICTSIIVAAELRYEAEKKRSPRLTAQILAVLDAMEIMPLDTPADEQYGRIRADLELRGALIGGNDLLIAAQAVSLGLTLVTDNEGEFSRVRGLTVENWLR